MTMSVITSRRYRWNMIECCYTYSETARLKSLDLLKLFLGVLHSDLKSWLASSQTEKYTEMGHWQVTTLMYQRCPEQKIGKKKTSPPKIQPPSDVAASSSDSTVIKTYPSNVPLWRAIELESLAWWVGRLWAASGEIFPMRQTELGKAKCVDLRTLHCLNFVHPVRLNADLLPGAPWEAGG